MVFYACWAWCRARILAQNQRARKCYGAGRPLRFYLHNNQCAKRLELINRCAWWAGVALIVFSMVELTRNTPTRFTRGWQYGFSRWICISLHYLLSLPLRFLNFTVRFSNFTWKVIQNHQDHHHDPHHHPCINHAHKQRRTTRRSPLSYCWCCKRSHKVRAVFHQWDAGDSDLAAISN